MGYKKVQQPAEDQLIILIKMILKGEINKDGTRKRNSEIFKIRKNDI